MSLVQIFDVWSIGASWLGQVDELAPDTCTPVNTSSLGLDSFVNRPILYIISQICRPYNNKYVLATINSLLTCLVCLRRRTHSITNDRSPGWSVLRCCHGITQGQLGVVDDLVSPAEWWASSWARLMTVGWRPECRWLGCRVADGICVRRLLGAVYGLLSLVVVVQCGRVLRRSWRSHTSGRPQWGGDFCVEGVEAFLLSFGKCPWGWAVGDYRDYEWVVEAHL